MSHAIVNQDIDNYIKVHFQVIKTTTLQSIMLAFKYKTEH